MKRAVINHYVCIKSGPFKPKFAFYGSKIELKGHYIKCSFNIKDINAVCHDISTMIIVR